MSNESKSQVVKHLHKDWVAYDEGSGKLYPFVKGSPRKLPLHILLDVAQYQNMYLSVKTSRQVSLYANNVFFKSFEPAKTTLIPIASLVSRDAKHVLVSFYGTYNRELIDSLAILSNNLPLQLKFSYDLRLPKARSSSLIRSFFTISLLVCFSLFALVRNSYPKIFSDFFNLFKDTGFESSQSRPMLDGYNLAFILLGAIFFGLAMGGFWVQNDHGAGHSFTIFWKIILGLVAGAISFYLLKYFVITIASWLFSVNKFTMTHYIIFTRVSVVWSISLVLIAILNYSSVIWVKSVLLPVFFLSSLFFLALISVRVSLVINRLVKVSTLYLISYLCVTEWLPYFILLKLYMVYFY